MFPLWLCATLVALSSGGLAAACDELTSLLQTHAMSDHGKPAAAGRFEALPSPASLNRVSMNSTAIQAPPLRLTFTEAIDIDRAKISSVVDLPSLHAFSLWAHMSRSVLITVAGGCGLLILWLGMQYVGPAFSSVHRRAKERLLGLFKREEVPLRKYVDLDLSQG